ncbi:hypothetical protein GLOIN_2v1878300 [Rhizophagus clarus]|uniref:BTB domain-containing protein n=1 Tax=Rhizophagus clarus TaxID=94130 RepID=A0A8H3L9W0_9GLOM|nr:hypothetical protein GLOIN_2v1878300 [Rhizophagus clarus]
MTSVLHSGLSKDLSSILNDADDYNVIIQVGKNNNIKEFRAHSVILRARSVYFKSALSSEWATKKDDMILYNKPNITPKIFDIILKYIYTGEFNLENYQGEDILELLVASDELLLEELFEHVQDNLFNKRTTWIQENTILVYNTAFKLLGCRKLQERCLNLTCINPQSFITSESFLSLDEDILHILLEREDLRINEIIVWENLIKWGIKQTPCLESINRTKWNNENFEALKETLCKLIPLIRFVEISTADYYDKIKPYKAIIPKHIYKETKELQFKKTIQNATLLRPRTGKIQFESKIIEKNLIFIIINWINRRESTSISKGDHKYKFDLIYRSSRDNSFKSNYYEQEPILVLVKCQNSRKIFGGYTPVGFYRSTDNFIPSYYSEEEDSGGEKNDYIFSNDSFIFSFEKNDDIKNMKLSRVKSPSYAIYDDIYNCKFRFGKHSLFEKDDLLYVNEDCYYEQKLGCTGTYEIDEMETWLVQNYK